MKYWNSFATPMGKMFCILNEEEELELLEFEGGRTGGIEDVLANYRESEVPIRPAGSRAADVRDQIREYMRGERLAFGLPLARIGTPFQRRVWKALRRVPFGKTITYPQLAKRAGNEAAVRASAHANGANPVSLIVPCHRVVGVDGSLRGYGGSLPVKLALIEFEKQSGRESASKLLKRARHIKVEASSRIGLLATEE